MPRTTLLQLWGILATTQAGTPERERDRYRERVIITPKVTSLRRRDCCIFSLVCMCVYVYVYMGKDSVQMHLCVCVRAFVLFTHVHILTHKTDNGSHLCKGRNGEKRKLKTNDKTNEKGEDRSKTNTYQKGGGMMHEEQQMQKSATEN